MVETTIYWIKPRPERLARFCAGYDIPEGPDAPTLKDILERLERTLIAAANVQCELEGHIANTGEELESSDRAVVSAAAQDFMKARALLTQFKPTEETSDG